MFFMLSETVMDWPSAILRLGANLMFIGLLIRVASAHTRLGRFSFTFLMISIIVYFLCYTLKNFDLNLGMALGLFAIFGIIRYRTEPLATEEMTYLFITIGMAVINALSDEFLSLTELISINFFVLLSIFLGERFLLRTAYNSRIYPYDNNNKDRIVLQLPYSKTGLKQKIQEQLELQKENLDIPIDNYRIVKIDTVLNQVVIHIHL